MANYMLPEVMANFFLNAGLFFAKISEKYQDEQQKYCIAACIFFCIASIEAYLNFLADDFIKKDIRKEPKDKIEPIYVDLFREEESKVNKKYGTIEQQSKYVNILDKLYLWPKIMTRDTFDKGAKPYQDFQKLVKFRDKMIHYKLKGAKPTRSIPDTPDSVENIFAMLAEKGMLYDNDVHYELIIEKAREALRTTYQVLKDLYGFYDYKDSWTRHSLNFFKGLP